MCWVGWIGGIFVGTGLCVAGLVLWMFIRIAPYPGVDRSSQAVKEWLARHRQNGET